MMKAGFPCLLLAGLALSATASEIVVGDAVYGFDERTGGIAAVLRRSDGTAVVPRVANSYLVKAKAGDVTADERGDAVIGRSVAADAVSFVCTNAALPGLRIAKRYFPVNGGLGRELVFINDTDAIRFVLPFTACGFDEGFLKDAYYLGAGYIGPLMPAPRVSEPVREETFVQTSKGMVLLNTAHPERGNFANMRVRVAGNPVLPWWQSSINSYRESEDRLWYLPDGWRMCLGTLDARPHGTIAYEDRLVFFNGNAFDFFDRVYGEDPAIRELYAGLPPVDGRMDDLFLTYGWGHEPYAEYLSRMSDRGLCFSKTLISAGWADYRWENGFVGQAGGWIEGPEARAYVQGMRAFPRSLAGLYGILIAADPRTRIFAERPDWFRVRDRNGDVQRHFPGVVDNYQTMVNKPECRAFLAKTSCDNAVYTGADYVYTDEAQQENTINWQQEELVRDDNFIALWADMRNRARAAGKFLFFNGSGNPFADINYMECSPRQGNPANWREFAGVVYGIEMVSRLRPEGRMSMINYGNDLTHYFSHTLAVGWVPNRNPFPAAWFAHVRAAYETGKTLPVDARYAPDWKRDPKTEVESYAVRRYRSRDVLVSFINRGKGRADIPVEIDLKSLGFAADEDVTVRAYETWYPSTPREADQGLSDREIKTEYARDGEDADKASEMTRVFRGKASGTLKHVFRNVVRNGLVQLVVTPGRVAIAAADGMPSKYLYTRRKGVEIVGDEVVCDVPCDIVFDGEDGTLRRAHAEKGRHRIPDLEASAAAFAAVRRRPNRASEVKKGEYPKIPVACSVKPCDERKFGVRVTSVARYVGSHRNLRNLQPDLEPVDVGADAKEMTLSAGTTRRNDTLDTDAYCGLRLAGARTLRIEFTNSFWCASSVFPDGSHVWGQGTPAKDFAGFVVDYCAAGGKFTKRVDFSVGIGGTLLANRLPAWGTGKVQDEHFSIGDLLQKPSATFSLDLAKHAPADWNGEVFLSLGFNHILANRRMRARILSVNDAGAADFVRERQIRSGVFVGGDPAPVALPRLKAVPELAADGYVGKASWGAVKGMQPYGADDFSEESSGAIAYDGENVYVDAFACESEKAEPKAESGIPYENDSFEFYFKTDYKDALQVIVDAAGRVATYPRGVFSPKGIESHAYRKPGAGWGVCVRIPLSVLRDFDLRPGAKIRFNLCRSRKIRRGERSVWAPVRPSSGAFRDYEKYGTLTFGRLAAGMGRWEEF